MERLTDDEIKAIRMSNSGSWASPQATAIMELVAEALERGKDIERLAAENAALREAWAKADLQHSDHCRYYPDSDESRCSCGLTALERAFATAAEPAPGARTWRAAGHAGGAR